MRFGVVAFASAAQLPLPAQSSVIVASEGTIRPETHFTACIFPRPAQYFTLFGADLLGRVVAPVPTPSLSHPANYACAPAHVTKLQVGIEAFVPTHAQLVWADVRAVTRLGPAGVAGFIMSPVTKVKIAGAPSFVTDFVAGFRKAVFPLEVVALPAVVSARLPARIAFQAPVLVARLPIRGREAFPEIGRASCRERV